MMLWKTEFQTKSSLNSYVAHAAVCLVQTTWSSDSQENLFTAADVKCTYIKVFLAIKRLIFLE